MLIVCTNRIDIDADPENSCLKMNKLNATWASCSKFVHYPGTRETSYLFTWDRVKRDVSKGLGVEVNVLDLFPKNECCEMVIINVGTKQHGMICSRLSCLGNVSLSALTLYTKSHKKL